MINIKILDIEGITCLSDDSRIELIPIYIACEDKERLIRVLNREISPNCEKVCRRFIEDKERFNDELPFEFYTYYNGHGIDLAAFLTFLEMRGILDKTD